LTNAVDFGTIGFSALGPATATSLGLLPQSADGKGKLVGNDISPGFNVGFLVELPSDTEIGVQYRSRVNLDVSGHAFFDVPANAAPLQAGGAFVNSSARAGITLPDSFGIGVKQVVSEEWSLFGEADWTHWTHFKDLRVDFDSTQPDSVTKEGWNNSWRFALGTSYEPCEDWTLRAGYAYQKTPIADAEHRTPRIPDQDRHWLTGGIGYDITDDLTFDLSYAHLFVDDASTNIVGSTGDNLKGDWDLSVDIVSAGFT
ncbi:MAG: outer membrane protein transport protein, partial [Bdellovibrionales bacterium]|nr:outer membrane protein transport protein [Bdellovibrionales bacterium]